MNIITQLFNKGQIECPRCLGKGEVDWDDIRRLKNELKWAPGKCAYCNGTGSVSPGMPSKVSVDNTYLTIDISQEERQRLINNDEEAIQRAHQYEAQMNTFILQIEYLHFMGNLEPLQIAEFYLIPKNESEVVAAQKDELIDYIERVIENKKKQTN